MTPAAPPAPHVFLFNHELEAIRSSGASSGLGIAHLMDDDRGIPEVVHLTMLKGDIAPSSHRMVRLEWRLGRPNGQEVGAKDSRSIVWIDPLASPAEAHCRLVLDDDRVVDCVAEIVQTGATAFTRNAAILETDELARTAVLCVGLGSGGSAVVDQLVRSGVGRFVLWDMDRLEVHNVGRHVCTLRDLGRRKVIAMRDHVRAINPAVSVECVHSDVLASADPGGELERAVAGVDCVIVGTDNNASRFAINDVAWRLGKPALYGRAFTRAAGGDVIQVLPPGSPCYACHVAGRVASEEVSSVRDANRVAYAPGQVPVQPGLIVDIQPIANMIARLCVLRLCAKLGTPLGALANEMTAPLYLWANRREEQFAGWRPMERSYDRLSVLRWYGINVRSDPECATCGQFAGN